MTGVHAARVDERLDEPSDVVVDQRRDDGGAQAEAAAQGAGDVVLAASLPHVEGPGSADARVPGIETQHHLAERDAVPPRFVSRLDRQAHAVTRSPATQAVVRSQAVRPRRRGWRLVARI